jgi:hypothetical protein
MRFWLSCRQVVKLSYLRMKYSAIFYTLSSSFSNFQNLCSQNQATYFYSERKTVVTTPRHGKTVVTTPRHGKLQGITLSWRQERFFSLIPFYRKHHFIVDPVHMSNIISFICHATCTFNRVKYYMEYTAITENKMRSKFPSTTSDKEVASVSSWTFKIMRHSEKKKI